MGEKRQFLFGPIRPVPWLWDTELQVRQGLVIKDVLFWGTLLKIDVIDTMTTAITALMVRPKIDILP